MSGINSILKDDTLLDGYKLSPKELQSLMAAIKKTSRIKYAAYKASKIQTDFHNCNAKSRLLSGGNQSGKTFACCLETCFHATGNYPDWYKGKKRKPRLNASNGEKVLDIWVIGTDSRTVKDSLAAKILGTDAGDYKDGMIHESLVPREYIIKGKQSKGSIESFSVLHKEGFMSRIFFKSYEQGRENLQSGTVDCIQLDEEPAEDLIGELVARTTATNGIIYMGFTPLKGMTQIVTQHWKNEDLLARGEGNSQQRLFLMSLYDTDHLSAQAIQSMEDSYRSLGVSEGMIKARMMGIPSGGDSNVYQFMEGDLRGMPHQRAIPRHWKRILGLDFGRGTHPTGLVWITQDPNTGCYYVFDAKKIAGNNIYQNAQIIKEHIGGGKKIPVAYPHDLNRQTGMANPDDPTKTETYSYVQAYRDLGLNMLDEHSTTELTDGTKSPLVEDGIGTIRADIFKQRMKVYPGLDDFFDEYNRYKYGDDGKPVKKNDDIMDAWRYGRAMFDRYAETADGTDDYGDGIIVYDDSMD